MRKTPPAANSPTAAYCLPAADVRGRFTYWRDAVELVRIDHELRVNAENAQRLVYPLAAPDRHTKVALAAHERTAWTIGTGMPTFGCLAGAGLGPPRSDGLVFETFQQAFEFRQD